MTQHDHSAAPSPDVQRGTRTVDASQIGFGPNIWPSSFTYHSITYTRWFFDRDDAGELQGVMYRDARGQRLLIVND